MNTNTSTKQNLIIGRGLKIYLIKIQNMLKFDLKHGYYHINKLVPFNKLEKLDISLLQILPVGFD